MYLSRSTWQALGLSVAGGYVVLGTFSLMFPSTAARTFFDLGNGEALWPPSQNAKVSPPKGINTPQARTESDDAIQFLVPLLGARDLSIAAALFTLHRQGLYSEVGTVILGGMLLCAADTVAVWKKRGPVWGSAFLLGAAGWGVIGWGLQQWY